ncbi:MAG: hypothetical protein K8I60_01935 [Anaerolineae bacterium]|nr:hypothetical protein [Anaerolineae bacterium]
MKDLIGLLKDDWQNLPTNIRYIFYAGVFLVFFSWLGDHWSDQQQYHLPLFSSNESAFHAGFWFIVAFFAILMVKQFDTWRKIKLLQRKYPVRQLDNTFHLINLKGWIYLFDEKRKERIHVKNPYTVADLWPMGEWLDLDISKDDPPETELTFRNGKKVRLGDYRNNPAGINTRS